MERLVVNAESPEDYGATGRSSHRDVPLRWARTPPSSVSSASAADGDDVPPPTEETPIPVEAGLKGLQAWEWPGNSEELYFDFRGPDPGKSPGERKEHKLGQLPSTAICGNDITSSCLYCAGFCASAAGVYAPISLVMVAATLYLFRAVYSEVLSAIPLNGGTYTVILNTTSKSVAAVAGALSFLSYAATAVVSGTDAVAYGANLWGQNVDQTMLTVVLLAFFCILNLIGITESSIVATGIFLMHLTSLAILVVAATIKFAQAPDRLSENWNSSDAVPNNFNPMFAIFVGFGSAMLGITGFESSANFVEQQQPGVFPKTLRNMWIAVALLNPFLSFLALGVLTNTTIYAHSNDMLAELARESVSGNWLYILINVDAFFVLAGSVLTGYVGVTGLLARLSLDRCLPQFLVTKNRFTHTHTWIIVGFFAICTSLLYIVGGAANIAVLEGVYTVAFLSVMFLFAFGNMLLKYKRAKLPRNIKASWKRVLAAAASVIVALAINVSQNVVWVYYFAIYFLATLFVLLLMFQRIRILKFFLYFSTLVIKQFQKRPFDPENAVVRAWNKRVGFYVRSLSNQSTVFFTKNGRLDVLNKAVLYVRDNEQCNRLMIVHCFQAAEEDDAKTNSFLDKLRFSIDVLAECYPKLRLDLVLVRGPFNAQTVDRLSRDLKVPKNFMFITCINDETSSLRIAELGGVRLITH